MMLYILYIPTVRVLNSPRELIYMSLSHVTVVVLLITLVSLKSHPNQYGLCQINAAILCKQAVILCHCAAILALLYSSK